MRTTGNRHGRVQGAVVVLLMLAVLFAWASEVTARGPEQAGTIYAIRPPNLYRHNIGLLDLMVTNIGVIGKSNFVDQFGAGWRGGEYLYAASLWIGAIASDNLPYVSTGAYEYELRPSLDLVDTMYPSYEGAPGGNRPGFSGQPDDDNDGEVDEDFLNGKDDDLDGAIDEDYAAVSQQMLSCEYWDYTDEARNAYAEHRPLNVRVRQESYAWSTEGANEFVGFDFRIINEGFELLRRVYLGFFVDSDAGPREEQDYYTDDRGAYYVTDTLFVDPTIDFNCTEEVSGEARDCSEQMLHLDICYMFDVPDDGESATGGDVDGFFGGMFLGHTTDPTGETAPRSVEVVTAQFFNSSNAYPAGDPTNDAERYDLLQSGRKLQRPTGTPDDYRYCFSAGPFAELAPGDELQLQVAFVIGSGKDGMLRNAVNAQRIYNGKWRNVDDNPATPGRIGNETCIRALEPGESVTWRDPCDSLNPRSLTVKQTDCIPDHYVNNDCNCCTPLFQTPTEAQQAALETLVHWVWTVAPPPPATNMDDCQTSPAPGVEIPCPEGDRYALIAWDNLSELKANTAGKYTFAGYQIWRVEGWSRPVGSPGPSPDEWQLIADVSWDPPDRLGPDSPYYLPKYRDDTIDSLYSVPSGATDGTPTERWYYPVGRYTYRDSLGLKNGMLYFYDVTAYSIETNEETGTSTILTSRPSAKEDQAVVPVWSATPKGNLNNVYVVPNPYIQGQNPSGWDLIPSDADPTGTKIAFVNLPAQECEVKIYTLAGDLVQTLMHDGSAGSGTVFWNLISRNGQDIVAGVYLYSVQCGGKSKIGRFVVVR